MFESQRSEDATGNRIAASLPTIARPSERLPAPRPTGCPENPIRLKTDGRHFFIAPSIWSA